MALENLKKNDRFKYLGGATQKLYCEIINRFWNGIKIPPDKVTALDVERYLLEYRKPTNEGYAKVSKNTLNSNKNGILYYYKHVLKKKFADDIHLPGRSIIKIKEILEIDELKKMVNEEKKERNKLILKVLYGTGLRVAELCNLKNNDIKEEKGIVR